MTRSTQRLIALGGISLFVLIALVLVLRGDSYYVNARFETAGQLVEGGEVLVGGQPVGTIEKISLTSDNQANIKMKIKRKDLTPLHDGTTATIRLTSFSGVANRYVSLVPGPNNRPEIPDDGVIEADKTFPPIDLDQFFNSLDSETRDNLRAFINGFGSWYQDDPETPLAEATYANRATKYFAPFFTGGALISMRLSEDQELLREFLKQTSRSAQIFASEKERLASLWRNLLRFTRAIASQSEALDEALAVMPSALQQGREAFIKLQPTMTALERLADESMPATEDLAPFLRRLRPLVRNAEPVLHDINALLKTKGSYNDLYDLLGASPTLTKKARSAFPTTITAMQSGQTTLDFLRPYSPEIASWISHFGQVSSNYDANGHYVRVQLVTGRFEQGGGMISPVPAADAMSEYPVTGLDRCPGSGQQAASDGSNPFIDDGIDCNPALVLPGP
jgi:phospholipid/cholesterol/gamma-HCH transport system substrate-binding protein